MTADKLPQPYADRVAVIEAELAEVRKREAVLVHQRADVYAEHAISTATFKPGDYVRCKLTAWRGVSHPVIKVIHVDGKAVTHPPRYDWTGKIQAAPERVSASCIYTCRVVTASGQARGSEVTFTTPGDYEKVPAPPKVTP